VIHTAGGAAITVERLRDWLADGGELALLDVREHGEYGEGHLFFAVSAPYSRLEPAVRRLVPRLNTRMVLCDADGGRVVRKAAARLLGLGYGAVHVLQGGTAAWRQAGHQVYAGVNVPSKAFGELVEHRYRTPGISARDLAALQQAGANVVVLDGRPVGEYRKMSIPGAICCPNGELSLRASEIVGKDDTLVVVNCAGRTRSIVGAQTLIDMGMPNEVRALENGTQGWYLDDLPLEHDAQRLYPGELAGIDLQAKQRAAAGFARRHGVSVVSWPLLLQWRAEPDRTVYLCDIRTDEEFSAGTLDGARHAPGGQLIQATDHYLGTRHARVVVFDAECVRAIYVAVWLKRLGWDVFVLDGAGAHLADGVARQGAGRAASEPAAAFHAAAQPQAGRGAAGHAFAAALPELGPEDLRRCQAQACVLIDLRSSMRYRESHVQGSIWSIRPRLAGLGLQAGTEVALLAHEAVIAELAAQDLAELGIRVRGYFAWNAGRLDGLELRKSPTQPPDEQCIDYLFFVHDRHDGNKEAARQYLAWEVNLLNQLDSLELASISRNL
jgi:rhodanese-related sulfurtransferase